MGNKLLLKNMSEADLQTEVIRMAKLGGWMVCHFRAAKNSRGVWATPIQGHAGFPDVVMVHGELQRTVYAELKKEGQYLKPEQKEWRDALLAAGQEWYLWRPTDLHDIQKTLLGHRQNRKPLWG